MTKIIATAGKGGTGKTTISALLLKYLVEHKLTPVLAVDADANANLNELLGLRVGMTVGAIRKGIKQEMPPNMSRDQYMEMQIHQALVEESGFDLLVMGQPDGPGCYCAANSFLAAAMDSLAANYRYLLVDNEAGMEHLSRVNLRTIDLLLVISDPSARGILTARRIADLTGPLGIEVKRKCLIINRAPESLSEEFLTMASEAADQATLPLAGILPASDDLIKQEIRGESYLRLASDLKVVQSAYAIFKKVLEL